MFFFISSDWMFLMWNWRATKIVENVQIEKCTDIYIYIHTNSVLSHQKLLPILHLRQSKVPKFIQFCFFSGKRRAFQHQITMRERANFVYIYIQRFCATPQPFVTRLQTNKTTILCIMYYYCYCNFEIHI